MIASAPYLLIDNSNSRTKFAAANRDSLVGKQTHPTADISAAQLASIARPEDFEHVVLSSVVPEKARIIKEYFSGKVITVSAGIELGIAIDFPDPSTIGADRLANAAAVVALYETPAVVVDFGTAVTFDVVSGGNAYIGGVIAPGLGAMTDYLHQRTALLPHIDIAEPVEVIGKSTKRAMLSGAVHGYRGLIIEILAQIERELGGPLHVITTGGDAELMSAKLPKVEAVVPNLTLEGLRVIANLNT